MTTATNETKRNETERNGIKRDEAKMPAFESHGTQTIPDEVIMQWIKEKLHENGHAVTAVTDYKKQTGSCVVSTITKIKSSGWE